MTTFCMALAILLLAYGGAAQNAACLGMALGLGLYVFFHSDD